jgi:hypothetical protein
MEGNHKAQIFLGNNGQNDCTQQQGFRCVRSTNNENPVERNRTNCTLYIIGIALKNVIF